MKGNFWILLTIAGFTGFGAFPTQAQFPPNDRCLTERESCAYQNYPQYNQQINYRTPQQIEQRRINSLENQCGTSNSRNCNHLLPAVEATQESPTMQQLRQSQIEAIGSR